MSGIGRSVRWGGVVVAVVGFSLTRFVVAAASDVEATLPAFLLMDVPPLILGFGLTVFGVALAVGTLSASYVATVAKWCVLGTAGMVLVLGLTTIDPMTLSLRPIPPALTANVLLGGAIGGTLTGLRSAENGRRRRELARRRDEATLLNRILRDEVLNAASVVGGGVDLLASRGTADDDRVRAIRRGVERIEDAVAGVGVLVGTAANGDERTLTDAVAVLESRLDAARVARPDATFRVDGDLPADATVSVDRHLSTALDHLLELAADRSADDGIAVGMERTPTAVRIRVSSAGTLVSEREARVLRERRVAPHDDPDVAFGVSIVGLLVDRYDGVVTVDGEGQTTIAVELPRAVGTGWGSTWRIDRYGVPRVGLRNVTVASLVAGVAMGVVVQELSGGLPVIGALYGLRSPVVGWVSHLFHSAVFGTVFLAALSRPPFLGTGDSLPRCVAIGVGFGALLWLVAAGIVMPVWLTALGIPAPVPDLNPVSLLGHLVWGATLAAVYVALPE